MRRGAGPDNLACLLLPVATWVTRPSAEFGRFRGAKESLHERMRHAGNNLGAGGGEGAEGGG